MPTPAWVTPTTWSDTTAITPRRLQDISDDLQYLYDTVNGVNSTLGALRSAPVHRVCSYYGSSNLWYTGRTYETGKIQVYVNGILRQSGTDWVEWPSNMAYIQTVFATDGSDRVDVLDWTP